MSLRIFEVFENSPAAVLQHVEHQLEAFGAFVIGVGNMVPTGWRRKNSRMRKIFSAALRDGASRWTFS